MNKSSSSSRLARLSPRTAGVFLGVLALAAAGYLIARPPSTRPNTAFDGQQAMSDLSYQVSLGPRVPDSMAHAQVVLWLQDTLGAAGWSISQQKTTSLGHPVLNVIAKRGSGTPWVILGAHYDSRLWATQDPDPAKRQQPVPGADDGASGVAVLTELGRTLPKNLPGQVWLAFFDAEDNGEIPGWDWLLGSEVMAASLPGKPDAVVVLDMVGDASLDIYQERNSNQTLTQAIWDTAAKLGYEKQFIPTAKYAMLDDHTPFLNAGIPAVDIIDFDYPYWHTTQDTIDKTSANSLKVVGETINTWLLKELLAKS